MRVNLIVSCLLVSPLLSMFAGTDSHAVEQPNIVLIVADDMGYSDLGCYGGEIETPHLDGLAQDGLRFTNYYVNNMCWPTRASLMTGLYAKTALPQNGSAEGGLHSQAITLPESLRQAGYTTLMSGKWHLSSAQNPDGPQAPHHRGFDHFYGTIYGASDFFAPADLQLDGKDMTHEWKDNPDYYYTDAMTDHALRLMKQSTEKPFFMYLTYTSAHWPLHAKPKDIAHYKGKYAIGWDKLRKQRHTRMKEMGVVDPEWPLSPRNPDVPAWEQTEHKEWQQRRMEVYAAQVTCMDRNIGRVVESLKETGQFENTLILYQHDNGGCHVEYGPERVGSWTRPFTTDGQRTPVVPGNIPGLMPGPQATFQSYGYGWANASNTPFRFFKQYDHEGGTRSPLIVSWPAGLSHDLAGGISFSLTHAIDMMPTLLDIAGVEPVAQKPMPLEGQSFGPSFQSTPASRDQPLFWSHNKGRAVREGDWKLVANGKGPWELYNLAADGTELNDLSAAYPEKVAAMKQQFQQWDKRTNLGLTKKDRSQK